MEELEESCRPVDSGLSQIIGLLTDLTGKIDKMAERVETLEAQQAVQAAQLPKFVPMMESDTFNTEEGHKGIFKQMGGISDDVQAQGQRQVVVGTDGLPRPRTFRQYPDGMKVKLAPNCEVAKRLREWANNPRRQGKRTIDPDSTVGVVAGFHFVSKEGEPKYRVRFPGITTARGDGFYASELVPA